MKRWMSGPTRRNHDLASHRAVQRERKVRRQWWIFLAVILLCGIGSPAWTEQPKFSAPKPFVLGLGDSLMFGFQQAKFFAGLPDPDPAVFNTGFADIFVARLAKTAPGKGTALVNFACFGETTGSFLTGPCAYNLAFRLHEEYTGAQMEAAESFLNAHRGQVSPILISLGANDVLAIVDVCGLDPSCIGAALPSVLATVGENLNAVLGRLRTAAPDAEIIMLQYYNPLAVLDPSTNVLTAALNPVIGNVAAAHRARVADAFPAFNLAAPQPATLCLLTLMCTPFADLHASDAGYQVISDLFFEAAGFTRFEH